MKLDMQLPYDTAIALLGIYYREITTLQKKKSNTGRELTAAKWCIHGGSVVLLYMSEIPIFFNSSTIKQNKINATPRSAL